MHVTRLDRPWTEVPVLLQGLTIETPDDIDMLRDHCVYVYIEIEKEFLNKLDLAKNRMFCNYAFYFGATPENYSDLRNLKNLKGCCGIKLFVGSSTGNLLVKNEKENRQRSIEKT